MDVVEAAWRASVSVEERPAPSVNRVEACDRCGRGIAADLLTPTRAVVSKSFTAFDGWAEPAGRVGLCPSCSWGYLGRSLRVGAHLVDGEKFGPLDAASALHLLGDGSLGSHRALIVAFRPGRQHLLPVARWGMVTTERATAGWTEEDVWALRAARRLVDVGVVPSQLARSAPPYGVLQRVERELWPRVLDDWAELDRWRLVTHPWLDLTVYLLSKESR